MARELEKSDEDLRQEGREEVLNWLVSRELISYSIPEDIYFSYDRLSEIVTVLPWRRSNNSE